MAIVFSCACGKAMRAKDELAGKKTKCPQCGSILAIPVASPSKEATSETKGSAEYEPDLDELLGSTPAPKIVSKPSGYAVDEPVSKPSKKVDDEYGVHASTFHPAPEKASRPASVRSEPKDAWGEMKSKSSTSMSSSPKSSMREYAYVLLMLALIPLIISIVSEASSGGGEEEFRARLITTMDKATPEEQQRFDQVLNKQELTLDELKAALPGGKLDGAHLAHDSQTHWIYALVSIIAFLALILCFFSVERVNALHLLGIGLFTGTVGIVLLLGVQFCSQIQLTRIRLRGWVMIIVLILVAIGWSYRSALDEGSNFFVSTIGFTFGVGLCEELCKALPLFFYFKRDSKMGWRGACLWGLASGIGFGVSEGIMYSGDTYNGMAGIDSYVVRFVSCVALHAMWAGAVGISIARTVGDYEGVEDAMGFSLYMLRILAVPMVLHGL